MTYILSQNCEEATKWALGNNISQDEFTYVNDVIDLPPNKGVVVKVGNWPLHNNANKLLREMKTRQIKTILAKN